MVIYGHCQSFAFAMIYYFIFKLIMRVQIPNYTLFLITGLFPGSGLQAQQQIHFFSFIANAQIIKKLYFRAQLSRSVMS